VSSAVPDHECWHQPGLVSSDLEHMSRTDAAVFFDRYQAALLDRAAAQLATMYAIPSPILFPGSSIPVSDQAQTEQFFTSSFDQYKGVTEVDHKLRIIADTSHSTWAEVTWRDDGRPRERFCYQLLETDHPQIAVVTPMELT
jgi:hypothetical protein